MDTSSNSIRGASIAYIFRFAAACLVLTVAACGGGGGDGGGDGGGTPPTGTVVGAAGGTVVGPNGARVVIPPGALATDTTIAIALTTAGAPALPSGFTAHGQMFAFTPHGTTFAVPVTMTLPFDPASVPSGTTPLFFKTAANQWEQVANATFGADTATAQVDAFSDATVVIPALSRNEPMREWEFLLLPGNGLHGTIFPSPDGSGTQTGGLLEKLITDMGDAHFDRAIRTSGSTQQVDGNAAGLVFSTADGVTYGVFVEAPFARKGGSEAIGSVARLLQTQSFRRNAAIASLQFTVSTILIDATDFNADILDPAARAAFQITGEVSLAVRAFKTAGIDFYDAAGIASVSGNGTSWTPRAFTDSFSRNSLWDIEKFDFSTTPLFDSRGGGSTGCRGTGAVLKLKVPLTFNVDISSIGIGEEFTLEAVARGEASNRRGGGSRDDCEASSASAFLRDPLEIGGATLTFIGLESTNRPLAAPRVPMLVAPASCVPGPGPSAAAGALQFDAASYTAEEFAGATPTITVTRTGGSTGAVTATFTTSDGTAVAGTDYAPVNATVFFGDGDAVPRVVTVPIVPDLVDEIDKTVNLTLSQPGGCAALGAQSTAVLTIRDDDAPPVQPSGLDPTFDTDGKATTTAFGGDRSGMALQADGKIVMVGGTFSDFVLARFNADGSIDTGFGIDGKVTTDMGSGLKQEEALAVAMQRDGKIVVAGYTSIPNIPPARQLPDTFALVRYNSDGSLDTGFGTGGRVSGNVNGRANAVVIQSDGKIVVAGEVSFPSTSGLDFSDFVVARFNTNGSLDTAFGDGVTGQIVTDFGNITNSARNAVLQPNGAIVVSGKPIGSQADLLHTDIVRYDSSGRLDASFGGGGKLTLAGVDGGQGLARQPDGKFILAGSVTEPTAPATARFLLKRLNADGSPDTGFGISGTVDTAFTESALASGVALQGDGKIVVVGTRAFSANPNFIVARYNPDGSVDRSFGADGNLSIDFFGFDDIGENVLIQSDGKIVVGGSARNNVDGYGVARISP